MDQSTLKARLYYNQYSGLFLWKIVKGGQCVGNEAGSISRITGYREIRIGYELFLAHRLAWIYVHGAIDSDMVIDHIDGNRGNNSISNLRIGSQGQNMQNRKRAQKDSKTGVLGVCFDKSRGKYLAQLKKNGRRIFSRRFDTIEEASAAYLDARRRLHEFNTL